RLPTRPATARAGRPAARGVRAGLRSDQRSAAGSVTGLWQANRSQTYTAGLPSTSVLPSSSGTASLGPNAPTVFGSNPTSATRATSSAGEPTIATSRGGEKWRSSAQSAQAKKDGLRDSEGASNRKTETARRSSSSSP